MDGHVRTSDRSHARNQGAAIVRLPPDGMPSPWGWSLSSTAQLVDVVAGAGVTESCEG